MVDKTIKILYNIFINILYGGDILGKLHDELADIIGEYVLTNIRNDNEEFKQIFSNNMSRVGDWDWPRPDYVLKDYDCGATYANEFKPPKQSKREYLTGLGQAMSYLQKHTYAGLMVPKRADDNFPISRFILDVLSSEEFKELPISLIEYDESIIESNPGKSIKLLKPIAKIRENVPTTTATANSTFWCFWRDASYYEVFELLKLSDKYNDENGDIYTNYIYEEFYEALVTGCTKQWNGEPRRKKRSDASKKSEKQNYKIPLFHLDLWNQADGKLTKKGFRLLMVGKLYGVDSKLFKDYLTYLILVDGKHLQLIHEIRKYQKEYEGLIPLSSKTFLLNVDNYLESKGLIGDRKPTAVTTNAKATYLRDEPKVWNHLGLLEKKSETQYFFPAEGYKFKWDKITEILTGDYENLI